MSNQENQENGADGTVGATYRSFVPQLPAGVKIPTYYDYSKIPTYYNYSMRTVLNRRLVVVEASNLSKEQALEAAQKMVNYFKTAEAAGYGHGAEVTMANVTMANGTKVKLVPGMRVDVFVLEEHLPAPGKQNADYSKIFAWSDILWGSAPMKLTGVEDAGEDGVPYYPGTNPWGSSTMSGAGNAGIDWDHAKSILAGTDELEVTVDQGDGTLGALKIPYNVQAKPQPAPNGVRIETIVNKRFVLASMLMTPQDLMQQFGTTVLSAQQIQGLLKNTVESLNSLLKPGFQLLVQISDAGTGAILAKAEKITGSS